MDTFGNAILASVALFFAYAFWCCFRINKNEENKYDEIQIDEDTTLEELLRLYDTYGANVEINNGKITRIDGR